MTRHRLPTAVGCGGTAKAIREMPPAATERAGTLSVVAPAAAEAGEPLALMPRAPPEAEKRPKSCLPHRRQQESYPQRPSPPRRGRPAPLRPDRALSPAAYALRTAPRAPIVQNLTGPHPPLPSDKRSRRGNAALQKRHRKTGSECLAYDFFTYICRALWRRCVP